MSVRRVAVVTVSRADWGPLRPVVRALRDDPRTVPLIVATGGHLDPAQGSTVGTIEDEGFAVLGRVPLPSRAPIAEQIAAATAGIASELRRLRPDVVLVLGDRFETLGSATATFAEGIPLAHLHGGEVTTGAFDNQFRYAITAMADLHLVATTGSRARLIAMGESPDRVVVTGAPGLDDVLGHSVNADELAALPEGRFVLVTVHPETLGGAGADRAGDGPARTASRHAEVVVAALDRAGLPCVITGANGDPGGEAINVAMEAAAEARAGWSFEMSLGSNRYRAAMGAAACMVGNSSSGVIEAASFGLRVVNIGERQGGRERSGNVVDVAWDVDAIADAVRDAVAESRWHGGNIYGDGKASGRVVEAVVGLDVGARVKGFAVPGVGGRAVDRRKG